MRYFVFAITLMLIPVWIIFQSRSNVMTPEEFARHARAFNDKAYSDAKRAHAEYISQRGKMKTRDPNDNGGGPVSLINPYCPDYFLHASD